MLKKITTMSDISREEFLQSKHFTLSELLHSDTASARGIDNTPTPQHKAKPR